MTAARTAFLAIVEYRKVFAELDANGGEVTPEIERRLSELHQSAESPAADLIVRLQALRELDEASDAFVAELRDMHARQSRGRERERERTLSLLGELLQGHNEITGEPTIRTELGSIGWHSSARVVGPDNVEAWPEAYQRRREVVTPDKEAARKVLDAGGTIEGLRLERTRKAVVRR